MLELSPPRIRFARFMGPVPRVADSHFELLGQDGGQSIPLGDGRNLFVFSDTLLRPSPGERAIPSGREGVFLPNCAAISAAPQFTAALHGLRYYQGDQRLPIPLLPASIVERHQGLRLWPEHGVHVDGRVFLYYLGIHHLDGRQAWSFELQGSGLAIIDVATGEAQRVRGPHGWALWPAGPDELHFGVQVLRHAQHLLIYATVKAAGGRRGRLYRAPIDGLADPSRYELLANAGPEPSWARIDHLTRLQACDLGPCGTEFSVSENAYLGGYLMSYVCPSDGSLRLRLGEHPWGPFSEPVNAGALPREPASELVYLAFEHPQFADQGGRTVAISYCQPHFVRNRVIKVSFA